MNAARVGIDLAKTVFQVHGVDIAGQSLVRRRLARSQLLGFFGKLPPCIVGMEACSSAHHWARELTRLGHEVRLIPPQYVKPYVKRNKTDAADAEAICEAVGGRICVSSRSRPRNSKPYWHCIASAHCWCDSGPRQSTLFVGCWVSLASWLPKVLLASTSYVGGCPWQPRNRSHSRQISHRGAIRARRQLAHAG